MPLRTAAEIAQEKTADIPVAPLNQRQFANVQAPTTPQKKGSLWQGFKDLLKSFDEPIDPDFYSGTQEQIADYHHRQGVMRGATNPVDQAATRTMAGKYPGMGYPRR